MQAIMLAAGMGRRLGKHTRGNTKCMIEVAGQTLLMRAVEGLKRAGIHRFIIVTGYKSDDLRSYVAENITDMDVTFVENRIYDSTNNMYSLYLARHFLIQDDTILLESDLVFDRDLIRDMVQCQYTDVAAVDRYEPWMDGTVTVLGEDETIVDFIEKKDFSYAKTGAYYKTVNIYKFSQAFAKQQYVPFLEAYIKAYGNNEYYEMVLKAIAHLSRSGLKGFKLAGRKWYEIDDVQDLNIANTMFAGDDALDLYQQRYGGYWRFSDLLDFCYLVNPYFPTQSLLDRIKFSFQDLISQYPSALKVQNINACTMLDMDEEYLLVGNGAAELINALKGVMSGTVGIPIPTFNEYLRCFDHCDFIYVNTEEDGFTLSKEDVLNILPMVDTIILINPNNPSGAFLDYADVIEVIEKCGEANKRIIVDESFIDFADGERGFTLLQSELLEQYPHLIVVKSISKSYGIPGLRLGVLASSDKGLIEKVKQDLPVWNVNSLAEYFLQIIPSYQNEYVDACRRVATERTRLAEALSKCGLLEVYESQANFLLCRVREPVTATWLTGELLRSHRILIKDLTGKAGCGQGEYVRIAVKDARSNNILIQALQLTGAPLEEDIQTTL